MGLTGFDWVLPYFPWFDHVSLWFYRVLWSFPGLWLGFYLVLLGFSLVLGFFLPFTVCLTGFHRALLEHFTVMEPPDRKKTKHWNNFFLAFEGRRRRIGSPAKRKSKLVEVSGVSVCVGVCVCVCVCVCGETVVNRARPTCIRLHRSMFSFRPLTPFISSSSSSSSS